MAKTWGILGKRQTYLSPGEQISKMPKVPLNANPLQSWDYKKSRYKRIDLFPKAVSESTQQGGVVSVSTEPTPPPVSCSIITFYTDGPVEPVFEFTDCNGDTHQFNGPQGFSADFCGDFTSASVISGNGVVEDSGVCSDPTQYNPILVSLSYNSTLSLSACSASTTTYFLQPNSSLQTGTTIYTDYSLDTSFYAPNGYYYDGNDVFVINTGDGQISSVQTCDCISIGSGFTSPTTVSALATYGDNIYVGGNYTLYSGTTALRLEGLNYDGSINTTFNTLSGITGNTGVLALATQSDGKVLVGGASITYYKGVLTRGIFRVNTNGSYDNTFAPLAFNPTIFRAIFIDSNGKIYLGGTFTTYNSLTQNGIIRLNSDGSKDATFVIGNGLQTSTDCRFIIPQSDGKVLVGGGFTTYSGVSAGRIVRLNNDGSRDTSFVMGTGFSANIFCAAQQADGKYVIGGSQNASYSGTSASGIIRLNTDGSKDTTFNYGTGFNSPVSAIVIQSDGKIIAGGSFTTYSGTSVVKLCRLNTDGTLDTTFNSGGSGIGGAGNVSALKIQSDGKILVGGAFTSYNGITYNGFVRLDSDGYSDMC